MLLAALAASRAGLWLFDLAVGQMLQERVGPQELGAPHCRDKQNVPPGRLSWHMAVTAGPRSLLASPAAPFDLAAGQMLQERMAPQELGEPGCYAPHSLAKAVMGVTAPAQKRSTHLRAASSSCSSAPKRMARPHGLHDGRLIYHTLLCGTRMTDLPCCAEAGQEPVEPRSGRDLVFDYIVPHRGGCPAVCGFHASVCRLSGCAGTVNGVQGSLQMLFQSLSYVAGLFIWQPQVGGSACSRSSRYICACFTTTAKRGLRHTFC